MIKYMLVLIGVALMTALPVLHAETTAGEMDVDAGLVGHWTFDEELGNAKTASGAPRLVPGIVGGAVRLDGASDALALGDGQELQPAEMTVAFWMRRLDRDWSHSEQVVFWSKADTDWTGDGWFLNIDGRGANEPVKLCIGGTHSFGVRASNNTFYPANQWVHVAISFSSANRTMAVYRNGVPQTVEVLSGDPAAEDFVVRAPAQAVTYLGYNGPTWRAAWTHAEFDDVRIYSKVVDARVIAALADVEIPPPIKDPLILSELMINGEPVEQFDPYILFYSVHLPHDHPPVTVTAKPAEASSKVTVTLPDSFPGAAQVVVTDETGEQVTYEITLTVARDWGIEGYSRIAPYRHDGIHEGNARFIDSPHFRIYYGDDEKAGPDGRLGNLRPEELEANLEYLEAIYEQFITELGYRSPGQPVHDHVEGPFKINIYTYSDLDAGGYMGYNDPAGLSFVILHNNAMNRNMRFGGTLAHEFGHSINLAEKNWNGKDLTGAYWETFAQFVAEEFGRSPQFVALAEKYNQTPVMSSFNVNTTIGRSHLSIIHMDNRYQNFMFFAYLTQNPDGIDGLGPDVLQRLIAAHEGQETPIHTLDRLTPDVTAQEVMARYNARLAFMDFENEEPRNRLVERQKNEPFLQQAYANLEEAGEQRYRVKEDRQPMYGGSNIIPLEADGNGPLKIEVINKGNGLEESDFTAILAVRSDGGTVRYHLLEDGKAEQALQPGDEAVLVVTHTPGVFYSYCAFRSADGDPERAGLNYEVVLQGAAPRYL